MEDKEKLLDDGDVVLDKPIKEEELLDEQKEETPIEEKTEEVLEEKTEEVPVEEKKEDPKPVPPKKKGHGGLIAIIIVLLLIVLGVLAAIFVPSLIGKKQTNKTTIDNKTKEYKSEYKMTGNGLEEFDLYFLKLENKAVNKIYSPLSIKYALEMLAEASDGDSKAQLDAIIGDYKAKKYPNNEHMSFANAMFIRNTFKDQVREEYTKTLQDKYNAEVKVDAFDNPETLNKWVREKTLNLLDGIFDESISDYNFFLVNALAIDMNWNNQLQCETTEAKVPCKEYNVYYPHEKYSDYVSEVYNRNYETIKLNDSINVQAPVIKASINKYDIIKELGEDNIRNTVGTEYKKHVDNGGETCGLSYDEFMNKYMEEIKSNYKKIDESTDFSLYTDDKVKVFSKDLKEYDGMTLQYVAVMPKEEKLEDYIKNIKASELTETMDKVKPIELDSFEDGVVTKIKGNIPLFKYDYKLELLEDVKKLGVNDIFDINKANLSKLSKGEKQFIDKLEHKANIEFSNDGIKASAITVGGGKGSAGCPLFDYIYEIPVKEIDITFDKPYMYIIRDKSSKEVWFTGTVYEPLKK